MPQIGSGWPIIQMRFTSEQHLRRAQALEAAARQELDPEVALEYARKAALCRVCANLTSIQPPLREPVARRLLVKWGCHFLSN
jgi:hypothetical protein